MFTTPAKNLDECTEHGTAFFAAETGADKTATHTSNDTSNVAGTAAVTVKAGAVAGNLANAKLTTDGVQTGGLTIENTSGTSGSQKRVDDRLSVAEKVLLAADKTITGGLSLYHTGNKPTKTDVGLPNVDNKSSVTIRSEIVDGDLAATTVIKTATLLAAINAFTNDIVAEAIENVDAVQVKHTEVGADVPLFDANGNLTFGGAAIAGIGVKSGADIRTPANIISVVGTDGYAKHLDLSSISFGNLDNILEAGIDRTVTANEKLGAARGFAGLNAAGQITQGTVTSTVARIDAAVSTGRCLWADQDHAAVPATGTVLASAVSFANKLVRWNYTYRAGEDQLTLSVEAFSSLGTTTLFLTIESLAGVLLKTGASMVITSLAYDGTTWALTATGLISLALVPGTLYKVFLNAGVAGAISVRGGMLEALI
jgi:hypothetical protein